MENDKKIIKECTEDNEGLEYEGFLEEHLKNNPDDPLLSSRDRDKKRIPIILGIIEEIWKKHPDTRLCQLIINAVGNDPYYLEDWDLIQKLEEHDEKKTAPFSGVFWIVNFDNFQENMPYFFKIPTSAEGVVSTYNLNYKLNAKSGNTYNHKKLWDELPSRLRQNKPFYYYPRGRVFIKNNKAIVYINPALNTLAIKNLITVQFNLNKETGINKIRFICDYSEHYKCYLDK